MPEPVDERADGPVDDGPRELRGPDGERLSWSARAILAIEDRLRARRAARTPSRGRARRAVRDVVVLLLAAVALVHTLVVTLWLSPENPVRDAAGPVRVARYVDPYFLQSWNEIDPSRQRVDEALRVQVTFDDGSRSAWFDITRQLLPAEDRLGSARFNLSSRRLAVNINAAFARLDERQQRVLRRNFIEGDVPSLITSRLVEAGADPVAIRNFVDNDTMTVVYVSLVAQARWGEDIRRIRYSVGRRLAVPYADRPRTIEGRPYTWRDLGWRTPVRSEEAPTREFDDLVRQWR